MSPEGQKVAAEIAAMIRHVTEQRDELARALREIASVQQSFGNDVSMFRYCGQIARQTVDRVQA